MLGGGTCRDAASWSTDAEMVGMMMVESSFSSKIVAGSSESYSVVIVLLSSPEK